MCVSLAYVCADAYLCTLCDIILISKYYHSDVVTMAKFSPTKTDLQLITNDYGFYLASYIAIVSPIINELGLRFSDIRIMAAIDALKRLYDWRLQGDGILYSKIRHITGFAPNTMNRCIARLIGKGLITEERVNSRSRRYYLTKTGKTIVNKITIPEKVHERIIEHLYSKRILK